MKRKPNKSLEPHICNFLKLFMFVEIKTHHQQHRVQLIRFIKNTQNQKNNKVTINTNHLQFSSFSRTDQIFIQTLTLNISTVEE